MNRTKGFALAVGFVCLVSTVLGTGYLLSRSESVSAAGLPTTFQKAQAVAQDAPHPAPSPLLTRVALDEANLSGSIVRLPLDAQESFFLSVRGDRGEMRYGVGAWASLIQQWRSEEMFADSDHAWIVYPKTHPETDAAGNKGTGFEKRLIPVEWRDGRFSWRLDHPQAIRWSSGTVMRLRAEPDPKDEGGSIMQVETAQVNAQGTEAEVAYFRGRDSEQSMLTLHMPSLAPRDNTWIAVRFEPREPAEDELVVIAVLSGKFVSSLAPSVSLSVGEAACLQVSRSRQVKIIQQAKLERRDKGLRLSWSPVESAYNPAEVWVYQTDKVDDRVERLIEIVQGGYPLNPYVMWATQSAIADF